jgi:DNA-binding XRE family transcriptional regulator
MPFTDHFAATRLIELREQAGLSQEGLAQALKRKAREEGWYKLHGAVDAFTIRRIERDGHCPSERVRMVIALFFDCQPRDIWQPQNRRLVDAEK